MLCTCNDGVKWDSEHSSFTENPILQHFVTKILAGSSHNIWKRRIEKILTTGAHDKTDIVLNPYSASA